MGLGERGLAGAGVGVESGLRVAVLVGRGLGCGRLVGGCEGALAVPPVAGAVLVPEGVVDGSDGVPEDHVVGSGVRRCGGHPFEVGQDIRLSDELLPVGRLVGADDGGVVRF